jgi:hypothetical protein
MSKKGSSQTTRDADLDKILHRITRPSLSIYDPLSLCEKIKKSNKNQFKPGIFGIV